jgi:hypothetical protein
MGPELCSNLQVSLALVAVAAKQPALHRLVFERSMAVSGDH